MQTTIADFVLSNSPNYNSSNLGTNDPAQARIAFESMVSSAVIESAADPTIVYLNGNQDMIAWYDINAILGFKQENQ
jgi:hypothetical protein